MRNKTRTNYDEGFATVYRICPDCLCRVRQAGNSIPGLMNWTVFAYPCNRCNGWSVMPIPLVELGL